MLLWLAVAGVATLLAAYPAAFHVVQWAGAAYPLFVDPVKHPGLVTFGFLAATVALVTFLYGLIAVVSTHLLAERMRANPRIANMFERLAGACLVGFGIKLAAMR